MDSAPARPTWQGSDAYEAFMGRWSHPLAEAFVAWFGAPAAGRWVDVGRGTGALTAAILAAADGTIQLIGRAWAVRGTNRTR